MLVLKAAHWRGWLNNWRYVPGVTPFSHWIYPTGAVVFYIAAMCFLTRFMTARKPMVIPEFLFFHNFSLCIASLWLGSWLLVILMQQATRFSPTGLICAQEMHENGHLQMIYYINSFFKAWEFIDTFLLILRKKPVPFLHSYHHAATLVLTWVQMTEHSTCQWVPIILNLWVHVVMYYYYAMSARGVRIWWKKYLTSFQITQFIVDLCVVSYAYSVFLRGDWLKPACHGTSRGAVIGLFILMSYLLLFVRFFVQTYGDKTKAKPSKSRVNGTSSSKAD